MKKTLVLIVLLILFTGFSYSQVKDEITDINNLPELNIKHQKSLELKDKIIYSEDRFSFKDSVYESPVEKPDNPNKKNPFLGGLFSGLIPGAGQFYAKSYIKSASFLAAEVGLWIAYSIFQKKGNDQTDLYETYANNYWSMRKYGQWLRDQGFHSSGQINPLENDLEVLRHQINICEEDPQNGFSHTLPKPGDQQYYEVIGKYQTYICGWSSADPNVINKNNYLSYKLAQVDGYMSDRQKANDYFDRGSLMITVVIVNHLLSAADGVWSVVRYNSNLDIKTSFDVHSRYSAALQKSVLVPQFNLSINF
jgi:hypothetical protein